MSARLANLIEGLVESVFPPACAACGELGREPFCRICQEAVLPGGAFEISGVAGAEAVFAYGGPVAQAVQRLKYQGRPELGRPLGHALQAHLDQLAWKIDVAVPVPLAGRRLRERGYNQARELVRGLRAPVRVRAVTRVEGGREQVGLGRKERLANLRAAFVEGPETVGGQHVLLVDDVATTGATAQAVADVLLKAGARSVLVLVLARTLDG